MTTKKAPAKSGKTPAKQQAIPGTKPKTNKAVEAAAYEYVEKRDERMAWTDEEVKAKAALLAAMKAAKLETYTNGEIEVVISATDPKETVKVKEVVEKSKKDDAA